jgi:hypothetical protein
MYFEILGEITQIETIARGKGIRDLARLKRTYGGKNWLKKKGCARVRLLPSGRVRDEEVHWYEAHGVGKVLFKIKRR